MSLEPLPEQGAADVAVLAAKAVLACVPMGGHAAATVAEGLATPLERRRERWLRILASAVDDVTARVDGLTAEALLQDERFVSIAIQATHAALRTHQEEKLRALRNAVFNAAFSDRRDEDKQQTFLRFVDELTPTHIRALTAARVRGGTEGYSYGRRIYLEMPHLHEADIQLLIRDLQARYLLLMESDYHYPGKPNAIGSASPLADEFLSFIGIPEHDYSKK